MTFAPAIDESLSCDESGREHGLRLRLDQIVEDKSNARKSLRYIAELAGSIAAVGLVEPLIVTPLSAGTFRILSGHRRFEAARLLGLDSIEVVVRHADNQLPLRLQSLTANLQRFDLGPLELAGELADIMTAHQISSQCELASLAGMDKTLVSGLLRLLTLPPALLEKVEPAQHSVSRDAL